MRSHDQKDLKYLTGFGNEFASEALPGSLPIGQNNPRITPYNLYAEQLSGTPFTAPRLLNKRSWLYRTLPSVTHQPFQPVDSSHPSHSNLVSDFSNNASCIITPNQLRWFPFPLPQSNDIDFISGLKTICGAGSPSTKQGFAIHIYTATSSMHDCCLANADGDFLFVPQLGSLSITTEFGVIHIDPGEICVIQRGMRFSVALLPQQSSSSSNGNSNDDSNTTTNTNNNNNNSPVVARGYILEVFDGHFQLPDLGLIGANGLANPRDFMVPTAAYDNTSNDNTSNTNTSNNTNDKHYTVYHKFEGKLFSAHQSFSPFNVVAWHGNYVPYKYNLARFCPVNSVSYDHPDPSIFTVLTCPLSSNPSMSVADFVIFPGNRWTVAEHTFRPPYYHRNCMAECMGLISGVYDAKSKESFQPGGLSIHNVMTPHGPDAETYDKAVRDEAEMPGKIEKDCLAFMFETSMMMRVTEGAYNAVNRDGEYYQCWMGLKSRFNNNDN